MHPPFRAPHAGLVRSFRLAQLVFSLVALAVALASGAAAPAATSANPGTNGHLLIASGHRHEMALYAMQPTTGDRALAASPIVGILPPPSI